MMPMFTPSVGVVPGTTTMQLGACGPDPQRWMFYDRANDISAMRAADPTIVGSPQFIANLRAQGLAGSRVRLLSGGYRGLGTVDTSAHIRWDLIALVGGTSLLLALGAGLISSTLGAKY